MVDKKAPELRFKGFTDDWEQRKLGDIGSVVMNRRIFKNQTSEAGDIPFYKIGTFGGIPDAYISRELFEEYKSKYPYPNVGDVLISASGSIGRTVVYQGKEEYFQDSNIVWLQHEGRIDNNFLVQFYSIVKWVGLEGSTIKRLYNKNILDTTISLPRLVEQGIIGKFFHQMEKTIALHQRKIDTLVQLKQGFLQQMFPSKDENVPKVRFADFKEDWKQRKLGEFSNLITKGTTPKKMGNTGPVTFVKVENIINGKITPTTMISTSEHETHLKRSRLEEKDILFSIAGTLGRSAVVPRSILPANTNQALSIIRGYDFNVEFLITSLTGNIVADYIRKNPTVGAQPNLSLNQVGKLIIWTPNNYEQKEIGDFFKQLNCTIALHQQKLEQMQILKQAYLQKLFI